ncbi:MAG: T9SS type A sorting domain-containing protein [Crocinitomicaceae bacterium]|nr:T9SS type A sorting domain-containing protein [Crocinitomicaceae bacterium]
MRKLILFIFLLFLSQEVLADHASGGTITYECLGNGVYNVNFVFVRDCEGINPENSYELYLKSNDCSVSNLLIGVLSLTSQTSSANCPKYSTQTTCEGGTRAGYDIITYQGTIDIHSFHCNDIEIFIDVAVRNVNSLVNSGIMRIEAGINNEVGVCNNSPVFTNDLVNRVCPGVGAELSYTYSEVDGDNVIGELICPLTENGPASVNVTFDGVSNCDMHFPSTANFVQSGNSVFFTPVLTGISATAFKLTEYDAIGNYLGYIMLESQIVSDIDNCINTPPLLSSSAQSGNVFTMNQLESSCFDIWINEVESENLTVTVDLSQLPGATSIISGSGSSMAVEVCFTDVDYECFAQNYSFKVKAVDDGCPSQAYTEIEYTVLVNAGTWCQENLYITNRNSSSGIPVPAQNIASNEIFVGNQMPAPYDPSTDGPEGIVEINQNTIFEAGVAITIPSCPFGQGFGDCVILNGNSIDLRIIPNNCSPDCQIPDIIVTVDDKFECGNEMLEAHVLGGTPPFAYAWTVNGQIMNINNSVIGIHGIVSVLDDVIVPFQLSVIDANGQQITVNGQIYGTRSFYEPLQNNMTWINFNQPNSPPSGYYYQMAYFYDDYAPFDVLDIVNITPPFYGATFYDLLIWNSGGQTLLDLSRNLEVDGDYSFDNGEIFWNGYLNNNINSICIGNYSELYNYRLTVKNCLTTPHIVMFHTQCLGPCYPYETNGWGTTAMAENNNNFENLTELFSKSNHNSILSEREKRNELVQQENNLSSISVQPNPANTFFMITGLYQSCDIKIIDSYGKVVYQGLYEIGSEVNVSSWESGIYYVLISQENYYETKKIVIQ